MPRGDKSKYTDKQERKADHIANATKAVVCQGRRLNDALGPPSTRMTAAGKEQVGPAEDTTPAFPAAHKGGRLGGAASATNQRPADQPRPGKQQLLRIALRAEGDSPHQGRTVGHQAFDVDDQHG